MLQESLYTSNKGEFYPSSDQRVTPFDVNTRSDYQGFPIKSWSSNIHCGAKGGVAANVGASANGV